MNIRFVLLALTVLLGVAPRPLHAAAEDLPQQISDSTFWKILEDFSEPDGSFRLENFMSNEQSYQLIIPALKRMVTPGGAYLGVGPEQNFAYILATQPRISFIVDIRRQNMLEHLLYKSLFERSSDRADFLTKLFSRKRPDGLDSGTPIVTILDGFVNTRADDKLYAENLADVMKHLVDSHGFSLSASDKDGIRKIYDAFFSCGPRMDFHCNNPGGGYGVNLTYQQLMAAEDGEGKKQGFLATEDAFRYIQSVQMKNLIVPIVGDFGGPRAIRAVAAYLKDHNATVSAFYISNVEDYLFPDAGSKWRAFYNNVATLPLNPGSAFVRTIAQPEYARIHGGPAQAGSWYSLLVAMPGFMKAFNDGKINNRDDVIRLSR